MSGTVVERQLNLAYRSWLAVQRERIRAENRLRAANLCRFCGGKKLPKKDHECSFCIKDNPCYHCDGSGLDPIQIPAEALEGYGVSIATLRSAEDFDRQRLVKLFRQHPLRPVIDECDGIGEELGAQLVGMIGNFGRFRNPSKLWAYLGLGVKDGERQKRRKGEQANFKPEGQVWAFKVGEQFWHWGKNGRYGAMYGERLVLEEVKKPEGAKKRAARYTVKQMLKHLWCVANGADER
jgi:Transposase IS116/IS110/IS902 family